MVYSHTGGNPLFIRELASTLRDYQIVHIRRGEVTIAKPAAAASRDLDRALGMRGVPSTLEGIIVGRIDRLPDHQRQVLSAASVFGQQFNQEDVGALAKSLDQEGIRWAFAELCKVGFLQGPDIDGNYTFRHVLIRSVTHNSLSFADRRTLHRSAAVWLEQGGKPGKSSAVLGHHYREAGDSKVAIRYLMRAGEEAVKSFSNSEAIDLLGEALKLTQDLSFAEVDRTARSRLELLVAEAFRGRSYYSETRGHTERGLALAGYPQPLTRAGVVASVVGNGMIQLVRRRLGSRALFRPTKEWQRRRLEAARAIEGLVETYFFLGEEIRSLQAALRSLNLAESAGESPELARSYATMCGIVGFAGMRRAAATYDRLALETARVVDDEPATLWVSMVVGIARLSAGNWLGATELLTRTVAMADRANDRRRWRDGLENLGLIAACQGNWNVAMDQFAIVRSSAIEDKDQRYDVDACRIQALSLLHLGRLSESEPFLRQVQYERDRGLAAEIHAVLLDLHTLAASIALERGDIEGALAEGGAALDVVKGIKGATSFPNTYLTLFLLSRLYLNLWKRGLDGDVVARATQLRQSAAVAVRAQGAQVRAHPIALPAYLLTRGMYDWLGGRQFGAKSRWMSCAAHAERLRMPYELALARQELQARFSIEEVPDRPLGLPLMTAAGVAS
jgi:tetratricopeptide (TPR) repeat protein